MSVSAFTLVFEHPEFLVIDKSPVIDVHQNDDIAGVTQIVAKALSLPKVWLVHRLDKATSGLLLLAKNQDAASALSQLFQERSIDKYYLAISDKKPKKKQGSIIGDMSKARAGAWKLMASKQQPAVTHFHSVSLQPNTRLYLLKPYTGKTHQLRVALKSIGSPIVGDGIYGGTPAQRLLLHAYKLGFTFANQSFEFVQPPAFSDVIDNKKLLASISELENTDLPWPDKKLKALAVNRD